MNSTAIEKMMRWFLAAAAALGIYIILHFIVYNAVRGDEFLSFLHSDPQWESLRLVMSHIHAGADNSYTHAALLYLAFTAFGYSMIVQRLVSLAFWMLGMYFVRQIISKGTQHQLHSWLAVFMIAFSNFGIYLATDGRFYAILFCLAAAQLLVYLNRAQLKPVLYLLLLFIIQLAGFLTSSNFTVLQCLFIPALLVYSFFNRSAAENKLALYAVIATALSSSLYFIFFRIPYFHHFFLANLFTAKPFSSQLLTEFISTPFRWIMIPHLPFLSDAADSVLLCASIFFLLFVKRAELTRVSRALPGSFTVTGIIALLLFLLMLAQLAMMLLTGFPLWITRYYAAVFFTTGITLSLIFFPLINNRILGIFLVLLCLRLTGVEFPKIGTRKTEHDNAANEQRALVESKTPVIFEETETDYAAFSQLGNMYVHNPSLRNRLVLKYNEKDTERANYFLRLKAMHYPLQLMPPFDSADRMILQPTSH